MDIKNLTIGASPMGPTSERSLPVPPQVQEAANGFESLFLQHLLEQLRKTSESVNGDQDGLIPRSQGEKIFRGLLDSEYAKLMTEAGGIGISPMVIESLLKK